MVAQLDIRRLGICFSMAALFPLNSWAQRQDQKNAVLVRGRLEYGSRGVANLRIRLTGRWSGPVFGVPSGIDTTSSSDGTFAFENVDTSREYTLIVRDFNGTDSIDAIV